MKKELEKSNIDKEFWEKYLENPSDIFDKENNFTKNSKKFNRFKFDFHGYTIEDANKKVDIIIKKCFQNSFDEILIITGKGSHSRNEDVYTSKDYNKLQNTVPNYIKNNPDLISKINSIKIADKKLGGEGAIVIKLKKIIK